MKHTQALLGLGIVLGVAGSVGTARAAGEDFGQDGQVILSGERLFGITHSSIVDEDGDDQTKDTDSRTNISVLMPQVDSVSFAPPLLPRAAIDVVVGSGVTLGGAIGIGTVSGSTKSEAPGGTSRTRDDTSVTLFTLSPRVGYALGLSETFAFWPRLGITYYSVHTSSETPPEIMPSVTSKSTTSGVALDIEPAFVFTPVSHFGILFQPAANISLSGSRSRESSAPAATPQKDDKVKYTSFGLSVGLLGYF